MSLSALLDRIKQDIPDTIFGLASPTTPVGAPLPFEPVSIPTITTGKLIPRDYQAHAIQVMREKKRALLWDQPGLGKTLIASEAAKWPILIACPTYLVYHWLDHLQSQYPTKKIVAAVGTRAQKDAILDTDADAYIVNIEMLRSFEMPAVSTFIVDEAHHVRSKDAKQSKGALEVARETEYVFLLTATPIYKSPDNLYMLFRILDPKGWTSYQGFLSTFCRTISGYYGTKVVGVQNTAKLQLAMNGYGLGRTYKDVAMELPRLIRNEVPIVASSDFYKRYAQVRDQFKYNDKDINSLMEAMTVMRRMTAVPKLEQCLELVADIPEAVIYTWYRNTAQSLAALLQVPCITGEVPAADRKVIAQAKGLVVATMASLSEGVDLSHLNNVIFFEGDYVPARLHQALSRVRRARDSFEPVKATFLYVKNTIDEIVLHSANHRNVTIKEIMKAALMS